MIAPTFDIEYIQPAKSVSPKIHKFIYLSDPICNGDLKVGDVMTGDPSGLLMLYWEGLPRNSQPIGGIEQCKYFKTLEDLKAYVSKTICAWWTLYGRYILEEN